MLSPIFDRFFATLEKHTIIVALPYNVKKTTSLDCIHNTSFTTKVYEKEKTGISVNHFY